MKGKGWIIAIVVVVVLLLFACCGCIGLVLLSATGNNVSADIGPANSVAVIRIEGVLASSPGGILSSATVTPEHIIDQLKKAENDSRVAAILLRIDSPGGSASASQEIYEEVKRVKKPVVVSIADVGASGAYYIASGAKEIWANRASTVGSIGVIMEIPNLEELYNKLGIKYVIIKQGRLKDIGSADRPMTDEEKKLLTDETAVIYDQFIKDVAMGRNMPEAKVRELATGMAWAGSTAKGYGLVDKLGNYTDALKSAGKLGKINGEPKVVSYESTSIWDFFSGVSAEAKSLGEKAILEDLLKQQLSGQYTTK